MGRPTHLQDRGAGRVVVVDELAKLVGGGPDVARLYRFAVDHGRDLESIPCYCGCGGIGHGSNRACYIKSEKGDGTVTYTSHAAT